MSLAGLGTECGARLYIYIYVYICILCVTDNRYDVGHRNARNMEYAASLSTIALQIDYY